MEEEIKAIGVRATEHPGVLIPANQRPFHAWEYRVFEFAGLILAEIGCIECNKPVLCRMTPDGKETQGAAICPHCQAKAYVRFDEKWFECS